MCGLIGHVLAPWEVCRSTSVLFNEDLDYDLCFCNSLECPAEIRPELELFDASDVNTENYLVVVSTSW